jgi:hypothetical protein
MLSANDAWVVGEYYEGEVSRTLIEHWDGLLWTIVPSPNIGSASNYLKGVAAVSASDVWAVGDYYDASAGGSRTLILHWDGSQWAHVPSPAPSPGEEGVFLNSVTAVSANDVWAVGYSLLDWGTSRPLILHWDGSQWQPPESLQMGGRLHDVSAVSSTDVWAVGTGENGGTTLAVHWDGLSWRMRPTPAPCWGNNVLSGVSAVSSADVWAVGSCTNSSGWRTLTLHWDGSRWNLVSSVDPASDSRLNSVVAISSNDVWAVGYTFDGALYRPLVERWDGSQWLEATPPLPGLSQPVGLQGVAAASSQDILTVGHWAASGTRQTLAFKWDGAQWQYKDTPNIGFIEMELQSVVSLSADDIWAVGHRFDGQLSYTLALHWDGNQWSVVDTPNQGPYSSFLVSVAASSPDSVWAIGMYVDNPGTYAYNGLIERWDGTQWTIVGNIDLGPGMLNLHSVAAVNSSDVWVVGDYLVSPYRESVALHWNGQSWTRAPTPNPGTSGNRLSGVTALASNEVWAVGDYDNNPGQYAFILRWNGTQWNHVPGPNLPPGQALLAEVDALSTSDIWAVGYYCEVQCGPDHDDETLVVHWDGTQWSRLPSPTRPVGSFLLDVTATSPTDAWAVGWSFGDPRTLIEHWNGSEWSIVPAPDPTNGELYGVTAVTSTDVWAVGTYFSSTRRALIERYMPCPPATATPPPAPSASASPTSPSATATATATTAVTAAVTATSSATPTPINTTTGTATGTSTPTATPTGTPAPTASPTPVCALRWSLVPSPNQGTGDNQLQAVAAVSANDIWAVGSYVNDTWNRTLVMHWDGLSWTVVPSPNGSAQDNYLYSVSAVSATDAWAVGIYYAGTIPRTQILHWDGTMWAVVASPNVGTQHNFLADVWAVSADDVWAVGFYLENNMTKTLALHWDGWSWSVVPSPNVGTLDNVLRGVSAASANDVWAVGVHTDYPNLPARTMVLHWDGTSWSVAPSPSVGTYDNSLSKISVVSADDAWAVGYYRDSASVGRTLVLHWDGTSWSVAPSPNVGVGHNYLADVRALTGNDVWAVGLYANGDVDRTLVLHWDGGAWSVVSSPNVGAGANVLGGLAAISTTDVWAVGYYENISSVVQTQAQHYTCLVTACTLQFSDVPADNTFYPFVRCLACQGIINGYPCGGPGEPCNQDSDPYFRPNNYVTRGQLAKIVSESVGFNNEVPPSQQTFADVPYGSTFWVWVERLAERQVMSGYPCGGPGEPCIPPDNRPYFRPGAGATRGQLTKIVSNAAGFNDIPPFLYTFADVPVDSAFWLYVERLLLNRPGVMGGYVCGGVGEPCDMENRPYFRPNNPLTRGQTSKIVANTFFPGCQIP